MWKEFVKEHFGLDASLKGLRMVPETGSGGRFSFEIEKMRGGKCTEETVLPDDVTVWLEKESTDILLHRLACPVAGGASSILSHNGKVVSLASMSCASAVSGTSAITISKSRLTSFKFGGH